MYKKALFWIRKNDTVACLLCPNNCILNENQIGKCRTRKNINNTLYTTAYNNPAAIHIDPIEKKPLYHFKPGHKTYSLATNGCVLNCQHCQNSALSQCEPKTLPQNKFKAANIVKKAILSACESIALTYSDPIAFYEYSLEICKEAKTKSIPIVFISSGYINNAPLKLLLPYLSAANIDLKAFNNSSYKTYFKGLLHPVLNTIITLRKSNVWLEITNLLIPGVNDNIDEINALCQWLADNNMHDTPLHFSKFHPSYNMPSTKTTPIKTLEMAFEIAKHHKLRNCYIGNTHNPKHSNTYCNNCNTLLINRFVPILEQKIFKGTCKNCGTNTQGIW